jgi:hypothetical protein
MTAHAHPRRLHAFDARSVLLLLGLTAGSATCAWSQTPATPSPAAPAVAPAAAPASAPLATLTASEVFVRSDLNRDSQLSPEEAHNLPSVSEHFERWDRDGNGSLSLDEFLLGAQQALD